MKLIMHSAPTIKKRWSYVAVKLTTKHKSTTPREFPGYTGAVLNATLIALQCQAG